MSLKCGAVFALAGLMVGCGGSSPTANTTASVVVPDVVGQSLEPARASLTASGWSVDAERIAIDKIDSSKPKPGTILTQDPSAGASAPSKTSIHLAVVPDYVVVPHLANLERDDAVKQLSDLGLKVSFHDEPRSDTPAGQVTGTNPVAGSIVGPGSSITLSVASKPGAQPVTVLIYIDLSTGTKRLGNGTCGTDQPTSLAPGAKILLMSTGSTLIGSSTLSDGTITSATGCQFTGRFDKVPPADSYTLLVGDDIAFQPFSFADAKANGFRLYFTYP